MVPHDLPRIKGKVAPNSPTSFSSLPIKCMKEGHAQVKRWHKEITCDLQYPGNNAQRRKGACDKHSRCFLWRT